MAKQRSNGSTRWLKQRTDDKYSRDLTGAGYHMYHILYVELECQTPSGSLGGLHSVHSATRIPASEKLTIYEVVPFCILEYFAYDRRERKRSRLMPGLHDRLITADRAAPTTAVALLLAPFIAILATVKLSSLDEPSEDKISV